MITPLSATERQFIRAHLTDDVRQVRLRTHSPDLPINVLVEQIAARQKAREKLPTWYANDNLIFPPALSVEQASSEQTAHYKASLVMGQRLVDLTGGMGVDAWAFAQRIERVLYIEQQPNVAELAAYNLPWLGATTIEVQTGDGLARLEQTDWLPVDWLYLDPHRRNEQGGRVVQLADCVPDITQPGVLSALLQRGRRILLKASPLLDISLAVRQLGERVKAIHVVATQGEVKEILFIIDDQIIKKDSIEINAINLMPNDRVRFQYTWQDEQQAAVNFGNPQRYLYEPNAALLKAGAFRTVAARYNLTKLAPNSHLYTSDALQIDFPGRIFGLQHSIKPDEKALKNVLPDLKANLTVRNFPQTVAQLRKKLSLREGGDTYILATTLLNGDKRLLITQKIQA